MVQRLKEQRQRSLSGHEEHEGEEPDEHEGLEYGLEGPQEPEESVTEPESEDE